MKVCDRGEGGKDYVTSHCQCFHNSQFYVLFLYFNIHDSNISQ